ncbi:MAG: hypothetical protein AAB575_00155 [Patescibacteria group bacterium]
MRRILQYFHHIHHKQGNHEVHHCGGRREGLNYKIYHCSCGQHCINKRVAVGHDFNKKRVWIEFFEKCREHGWHVESGKKIEMLKT